MSSLVFLKKSNNTTYVYDNVSTWNKERQRCDCKRKCIGKLDPITNEIVYNAAYQADHGIEAKENKTGDKKPKTQMAGATLLYDVLSQRIGLSSVLKECFPDRWKKLLTLAYYFLSEGNAMTHCEAWSRDTKTPLEETLSDQRISELIAGISPDDQMHFYKQWLARRQEEEYFALDITSISSYSELNRFVRYGYNRDGEKLPQINLCMLLGEKSRLPVYYEILPGSIHDVSTLSNIVKQLDWMNATRFHMVMDKGFYSEKNIDAMYGAAMKFIIGVSLHDSFAKECIDAVRTGIDHYENYHIVFGNDVFIKSSLSNWKGHRLYVHICYDSAKADGEYRSFLRDLHQWQEVTAAN